jgi:hypothetical protein
MPDRARLDRDGWAQARSSADRRRDAAMLWRIGNWLTRSRRAIGDASLGLHGDIKRTSVSRIDDRIAD